MRGKDGDDWRHLPHDSPNLQINKQMTPEEIKGLADLITAKIINCTKEVLTSDEAAQYMGISKSYLYKLTMRKEIPHFKPMGKVCYFNRLELQQWLQRNRYETQEELDERTEEYLANANSKGGLHGHRN